MNLKKLTKFSLGNTLLMLLGKPLSVILPLGEVLTQKDTTWRSKTLPLVRYSALNAHTLTKNLAQE